MTLMRQGLILLSLASPLFGGTVNFGGHPITYDDAYSLKDAGCPDWTDQAMDGKVMYALSFECDERMGVASVFPPDIDADCYNCNLCRVEIPAGLRVHDFFHTSGCPQ